MADVTRIFTIDHVDEAIAMAHGQPINGLGDRAAWYPNPGANVGPFGPVYSHLTVWEVMAKDWVWVIMIQMRRSNGEASNDLEGYKVVAREMLRRTTVNCRGDC